LGHGVDCLELYACLAACWARSRGLCSLHIAKVPHTPNREVAMQASLPGMASMKRPFT
jgi:hypothetical protein